MYWPQNLIIRVGKGVLGEGSEEDLRITQVLGAVVLLNTAGFVVRKFWSMAGDRLWI